MALLKEGRQMVIALSWGGENVCPLITPPVLSELALTLGLYGRLWRPLSGMELLKVTQVTTGSVHAHLRGVGPIGSWRPLFRRLNRAICR